MGLTWTRLLHLLFSSQHPVGRCRGRRWVGRRFHLTWNRRLNFPPLRGISAGLCNRLKEICDTESPERDSLFKDSREREIQEKWGNKAPRAFCRVSASDTWPETQRLGACAPPTFRPFASKGHRRSGSSFDIYGPYFSPTSRVVTLFSGHYWLFWTASYINQVVPGRQSAEEAR